MCWHPRHPPQPIADKIAGEIAKASQDVVFVDKLAKLGANPSGIGPSQFAELIAADLKLWAEAVASAGVKFQ